MKKLFAAFGLLFALVLAAGAQTTSPVLKTKTKGSVTKTKMADGAKTKVSATEEKTKNADGSKMKHETETGKVKPDGDKMKEKPALTTTKTKTAAGNKTKTAELGSVVASKVKKDGTPDKRYKANKTLKKDGTPDMRYKENKQKKN